MKKEQQMPVEAMAPQAAPAPMEGDMGQAAAAPMTNPFADKAKTAFPDREFASDDEINQAILEKYDELEGYHGKTSELLEKLSDILDAEPAIAAVLKDMIKGATFAEAISRNVDLDEITPIEGEPDYDLWANNLQERQKSKAEKEQQQKTMQENLDFSRAEIAAFAEENGMSNEDASKFLGTVDELVGEVVSGKLTKKTLAKLKKAIDYDMDITQAAEMGEIKGRNAKIEAVRADASKPKGDGLPTLAGGQSESTPVEKDYFSEAIDADKKRHNKF
jgi:hypothetical protein